MMMMQADLRVEDLPAKNLKFNWRIFPESPVMTPTVDQLRDDVK